VVSRVEGLICFVGVVAVRYHALSRVVPVSGALTVGLTLTTLRVRRGIKRGLHSMGRPVHLSLNLMVDWKRWHSEVFL